MQGSPRELTEVAPCVLVARARIWASNTVVVACDDGSALLIDPGIEVAELESLAAAIAQRGWRIAAGVATHPHWDHVLWHASLGDAPRFAPARAVEVFEADRDPAWANAEEAAPGHDPALFGRLTPMPDDVAELPSPAPAGCVLIRHDAHAPGHLALAVGRVLIAGDMLSQRETPLLDVGHEGERRPAPADPVGDYRAALDLLERRVRERGIDVIVPGHGPLTRGATAIAALFARDRAYLDALEEEAAGGPAVDDPRLADPWVAEQHAAHLAALRGG